MSTFTKTDTHPVARACLDAASVGGTPATNMVTKTEDKFVGAFAATGSGS